MVFFSGIVFILLKYCFYYEEEYVVENEDEEVFEDSRCYSYEFSNGEYFGSVIFFDFIIIG